MKNAKTLLYIVLSLTAATTLAGCNSTEKDRSLYAAPDNTVIMQEDDTRFLTDMVSGQDYANGAHMEVLESNPLILTEETDSDMSSPASFFCVYNRLEGLSDKHIQDDINKHIRELATDWCRVRPVPSDDICRNASPQAKAGACYGVTTDFSFNYGDFLSGIMTRSIDYYDPASKEHSVFVKISPLNFDLRTGEEFTVAALFTEGYDYKSAIADGAESYCRSNGINPEDLSDISENSVFCLSESGLVLYPDKSYESQGIVYGSGITIPFSRFGSNWAISRRCSAIYTNEASGHCILLANPGENLVSDSVDIYAVTNEDGSVTPTERLSVVLSHTYPDDFPVELFEKPDAYSNFYKPSTKQIEALKRNETQYVDQLYHSVAGRVGSYFCITMNAEINQNGELPVSATRQYVFDKQGQALGLSSCFASDYDYDTLINTKLGELVNGLMDAGWLIESEIDKTSIDFMLGTDSVKFTTAPVRRSRVVIAADGSESKETVCASLSVSASYDEIGAENLCIFALQ